MSRRTELGTIQGYNLKKGKRGAKLLRYDVLLELGAMVVVNEALIAPRPIHRLNAGQRLRVEMSADSVISAVLVEAPPAPPPTRPMTGEVGQPQTTKPPTPPASRTVKQPEVGIPEVTPTARGQIMHLFEHYLTVEFEGGVRANLALDKWPPENALPREGGSITCRYSASRFEIVEVLSYAPPPASTSAGGEDSAERAELLASIRQRQSQPHRHEILAFLDEHANDEHIEWYRMRPEKPARYAEPQHPLPASVENAIASSLNGNGFRFFGHQARALDALRAGRNVLLVTQTASGKTLCYNPAVFETVCQDDPTATALYIFPLNALLMDQTEKIKDLQESLRRQGVKVDADLLVGGMALQMRAAIARRCPNIIGTNPEMLGSLLRGATYEWQTFFERLRYVVIDEVHFYRGLLGVHMAGLLRRLGLTCARFGSAPQYVLSSATVSQPLDLAARLTALPPTSFELLDEAEDGSRQALKHWALFSPEASLNPDEYDGYVGAAALAMVDLLCARDKQGKSSPLNTILFAKSIRDVNHAYQLVRQNLQQRRPDLVKKVTKYASAELTHEGKREIYDGLRTGRYLGVVATNALEAGVDIGHLDACIIAGFPYTVMRMRQMAGRVGRRDEGLVLFVPQPSNPVDDYYRNNPALLLEQPPELFVVDAENPYIFRKHLNAAAYELRGISLREAEIFGPRTDEIVGRAISDRVMRRGGDKLWGSKRNFQNLDDVYAIHNIRSNVQRPWVICESGNHDCPCSLSCFDSQKSYCKTRITVTDEQYIYRDCHPGAIYEDFEGNIYKITSMDQENKTVRACPLPEGTLDRTFVDQSVSIEVLGEPSATRPLQHGAAVSWGPVRVTKHFDGFFTYSLIPARRCRKCRKEYEVDGNWCPDCERHTEKYTRQSKPVYHDFPPPYRERGFQVVFDTIAAWLTVPPQVEGALTIASPCKLPGKQNQVQSFLKRPLRLSRVKAEPPLSAEEQRAVKEYHHEAGLRVEAVSHQPKDTVLFPGVYGHCLMHSLRWEVPEERALSLFESITGYPASTNARHVCRRCWSSPLMPALHTLEHTVVMRYPSVALGDREDLGSHTTLGHPNTGLPTVFWFDAYEGGIGAAEKIFDRIEALLRASVDTVEKCRCTSLEGCPRCTQLAHCDLRNDALSKVAARVMAQLLLGEAPSVPSDPFVYRAREERTFEERYKTQEWSAPGSSGSPHGVKSTVDPYHLLRLQQKVHEPVLRKAFEVRSGEIGDEIPPVSATELEEAYRRANQDLRPTDWTLPLQASPYEILEMLSSASSRMVGKIYHVIARELHPDLNPNRREWAEQMMKAVNNAYDQIRKERSNQG